MGGVDATSAYLNGPQGVAVDGAGNLYIADTGNQRIRKVTAATGIITTVAGTGTGGFSGDGGAATSAQLYGPFGVVLDGAGNLYIGDTYNNRIRKVTAATGKITTVAGTGTANFSGDGGAATSAQLGSPFGVALDGAGNLYIADYGNNRIRKVTAATGLITTVAGNGTSGFSGDGGAATSATLNTASGVAVDGAGNLYIADTNNNVIRKVTAATGKITTLAGTGTQGFSGDGGTASSAQLNTPYVVAISGGNLYIADSGNNRIRLVANAPLPVSLVSFSALPQPSHTVLLQWTTALETNNKAFAIERSKDLMHFEPVGQLTELAPASNALTSYALSDPTPYAGTSYYRLSQTDLNGQLTRFPTVSVILKEEGYGVSPNPVVTGSSFVLRLDEPQTAQVGLYSAQGQVLAVQSLGVESGRLVLRAGSWLVPGVYVLRVEERGQIRQHRLVVVE